MNQDDVKEKLLSLNVDKTEFDLIFTGKQSQKVNGLYRPDTREIIIHNKNFDNDNTLMYTALHEYTHHVGIVRKVLTGKSAHPVAFWALFHSIVDLAIERGIYTDVFKEDRSLAEIDRKVAAIAEKQIMDQRELGMALLEMQTVCKAKGARFEDYLDRHARVPKDIAKASIASQLELFNLKGVSPQVVELVASIDGGEKREEAIARFEMGQSIPQVKAIVKQGKKVDPLNLPKQEEEDLEDVLDRLVAERKRLNEKIQSLTLEMQCLDESIKVIREKLPHLDFDEDGDDSEDSDEEDISYPFNMGVIEPQEADEA